MHAYTYINEREWMAMSYYRQQNGGVILCLLDTHYLTSTIRHYMPDDRPTDRPTAISLFIVAVFIPLTVRNRWRKTTTLH